VTRNRYVERSDGRNLFFRRKRLIVQAEWNVPGFKGQEPVGIFPVFEYTKGPVTAAFFRHHS